MLSSNPQDMDPAIRQYEFVPASISLSWRKKVLLFFALGCFMFGFRWIVEGIFHWEHRSLLKALIDSVIFASVFFFRPFARWLPRNHGSVILGKDFVEGHTCTAYLTFKKRIPREKIKSISENRRGLCVMDRGEFAARMLGFIFVPATMPEYQEIKATLAQWAVLKSQG